MSKKKKVDKSVHYPNGLVKTPSRMAIFQCYDKDGMIDEYIPYCLRDLKENLERLVIVVNGMLTLQSREKLLLLTPDIFVREDKGFAAAAWREAMIDYLGWEKLEPYDEVILLDDTFFGPFYPFREVFQEMDPQPVDFWGITACGEGVIPDTPAHIQTHFTVIRKFMLQSPAFRNYWENQPCYATCQEATCGHEAVFTQYFQKEGYVWDIFADMMEQDGGPSGIFKPINHSAYNAYELLLHRKCPILSKSGFMVEHGQHLDVENGIQLRRCIEHIKKNTNYDVSLIFKHLLRVCNIADIFQNLHLTFILPKGYAIENKPNSCRAVFGMHIFYVDQLEYIKNYIISIPQNVDVILTTPSELAKEKVRQCFLPYLGGRLRVMVAQNRGRDMSALLVEMRPYLYDYDFVGFCHDKRAHKGEPITVGMSFQELTVENVIASTAYIENIFSVFEEYPEIGFLSPPQPHHANYSMWLGSDAWPGNQETVTELAIQLQLNVDISEEKPLLALGSAFWCRREALAPLLDYPWEYKDFPPEPCPINGALIHALERIFPFVAQQQGYLSGWILTDEYASAEINNLHYLFDKERHKQAETTTFLTVGLKNELVLYVKKHLPQSLWGSARMVKRILRW